MSLSQNATPAIRWIARATGILVAIAFLLLSAGELWARHAGLPTEWREWAGITLLATACLSLVAALRWEAAGAIISLVALAGFCAAVGFDRDLLALIAVVGLPGVLHLAVARRTLPG